jgi:hypothetical protein
MTYVVQHFPVLLQQHVLDVDFDEDFALASIEANEPIFSIYARDSR